MEEEKINEEKEKEKEEKLENVKIAKIELGKDHTAIIETDFPENKEGKQVINFKFKVHNPTMKEDLKIAIKEEEILGNKSNDQFIALAARMLATLEICIDEIWYSDEGEFKRFFGTFLELTDKIRNIQHFYKEVVFPIYDKVLIFINDIEMDFDDLKKQLAQTGKR